MRIDNKSIAYRLLIPVFLTVTALSAVLILSIHLITRNIIEEFVGHAISSHVSETMSIIKQAQSDLATAMLLDNPSVVEAKKMSVIEAIALSWQRRDVWGAITNEKGDVVFSNLQPEIIKKLSIPPEAGLFHLDQESSELIVRTVRYPIWGWDLFVGVKSLAPDMMRKEVYYLLPLVVIALMFMIFAVVIILRRNLQKPVYSLMAAITSGDELPYVGITELDNISTAMNETMGRLRVRSMELASELEERSKAEAGLRAEKNKSEAIIAAMGDGISIQDRDFKILYQNDVHKSFVGSHPGEYCFRAYESRDDICEGCPVMRTFNDGKIHTDQRTVQNPEGTKYFEITTSPLRDAEGSIVAGIEVVRDVTQQRKNEELLRQSQKMEGIGQLAGGIAHDFNNILTAIIGYASLLELRLGSNEHLRPFVRHILEATERASGLTKSLLAFSRKQPVQYKPLRLNELVSNFQHIMGRLIGEEITLEIACAQEDLVVEADKGQLEQVLLNLTTNARDAMPDGGKIKISTDRVLIDREMGDLRKGSYAVIDFFDNGIGIDPKVQEHIFEPFFTTKEVGKGTGLGLSVAYGIIKKHGGSIDAFSNVDKGTTFRMYLPIARREVFELLETAEALPHGTETILLVEDNEETRRITRRILEEFGYRVIEAVDGEEAVSVFREKQNVIQLVLSDLIMPKKNGKEACEEIVKICPDAKIILMSGYTADIIDQKGSLDKRMHFVSKPLSPSSLLIKIRDVLAA